MRLLTLQIDLDTLPHVNQASYVEDLLAAAMRRITFLGIHPEDGMSHSMTGDDGRTNGYWSIHPLKEEK